MELHPFRARERRRLVAMDAFRTARKILSEDITVFGEQLTELPAETVSPELAADLSRDYQLAVDLYEASKRTLSEATTAEEVAAVEGPLNEGRFHLARVLARRDGDDLPTRREPCFFNPQHGPAVTDVWWAPQGGTDRQIQICRRDADSVAAGEPPDVRLVRAGDRYVPWYAAGGSITTIVERQQDVTGNNLARVRRDKYLSEARMRSDLTNLPYADP
jgi:hypothetical protein